jgi:hypothetical protein
LHAGVNTYGLRGTTGALVNYSYIHSKGKAAGSLFTKCADGGQVLQKLLEEGVVLSVVAPLIKGQLGVSIAVKLAAKASHSNAVDVPSEQATT